MLLAALTVLLHQSALAEVIPIVEGEQDLFSFVTRPEIRSPRFNVSIHKADLVTPGYWFVAPYVDLHSHPPTNIFSPWQTGPHIYDSNGELVWCGSQLYGNRATFDFRVGQHDDGDALTFIVGHDEAQTDSPGGAGIILNSSYDLVQTVQQRNGQGLMNMHEFQTIEEGERALTITYAARNARFEYGLNEELVEVFVGDNGFAEIDTVTGETLFSWWALDHLQPSESQLYIQAQSGPGNPWDFFHLNSVDRISGGDYLISARHTGTLYKISGKDGSIIWRLGGSKSDFKLQGFNISFQHDARLQSENKTTVVLTMFNNHADLNSRTAVYSSANEIALDLTTMTASVVTSWDRPDGRLTKLRGNAQRLPNGHMFVGWSENSYISEFDAEGGLIMEAQMMKHRFSTYRAYKFNFTATPSEPIAVKSFVYGANPNVSTTVVYVSWNGATEVSRWRFWAAKEDGRMEIGTVAKQGFETVHMMAGVFDEVLVEALDIDGSSLQFSGVVKSGMPSTFIVNAASWESADHGNGNFSGTMDLAEAKFAALDNNNHGSNFLSNLGFDQYTRLPTMNGFAVLGTLSFLQLMLFWALRVVIRKCVSGRRASERHPQMSSIPYFDNV